MKITAKCLRKMGACEKQVKVFEKEWPNGAQTTLKNLLKAVELGLHLDWFVINFLTYKQDREYSRKVRQAWEGYNKWDEYDEKKVRILFDTLKRKR